MSREEAAAKAMFARRWGSTDFDEATIGEHAEHRRDATSALTAADSHDAAHGIYRTPESEVTALIVERDEAQWWADKLAAALAPADVLGEHSSMNAPWANAFEHAAGTRRIKIDDATVERAARAFCGDDEPCDWCLTRTARVLAAAVEVAE